MLGSVGLSIAFRANFPLRRYLTTLYTNPVTIVPLYLVAYEVRQPVLPRQQLPGDIAPSFHWSSSFVGDLAFMWMGQLGKAAGGGASCCFRRAGARRRIVVRLGWRWHVVHVAKRLAAARRGGAH